MSIVTNRQAGTLAVTGADPVPWWIWAIAGGLLLLGLVFLLLQRRNRDDDEALAAPIIATVDPSTGQGVGTTTPIPVGVSDEEAMKQVFKPTATPPTPDVTDAGDHAPSDAAASDEPETSDESNADGSDDPDAT